MAESLDEHGEPKTRKRRGSHGEEGHNSKAVQAKASPLFRKLDKLRKEQEEANAQYRNDFKVLYDEAATAMNIAASRLRKEYRKYVVLARFAEDEMMLDTTEREQTTALRDALEGTPFAEFLSRKLATPPKGRNGQDAGA